MRMGGCGLVIRGGAGGREAEVDRCSRLAALGGDMDIEEGMARSVSESAGARSSASRAHSLRVIRMARLKRRLERVHPYNIAPRSLLCLHSAVSHRDNSVHRSQSVGSDIVPGLESKYSRRAVRLHASVVAFYGGIL